MEWVRGGGTGGTSEMGEAAVGGELGWRSSVLGEVGCMGGFVVGIESGGED